MGFQTQMGFQSAAANLQAQIQAMNGNFNGQVFFGTPSFTTSYMPPVYNGMKSPFGAASPVSSPMMSDPSAGYNPGYNPSAGYNSYNPSAGYNSYNPSAGYNPYAAYPGQSAQGPVLVSQRSYGTPTLTSSNYASVNAAIAGVSNVPGVGAPVSGLPPGATNLGPSSLIPGAFISGIKYGAAY